MIKKLLSILAIALSLNACHQQQTANTIKVGGIAGPEIELLEAAKQVALKQYGLNIDIVQFTDYTMPNAALNNGSIDANMFQHQPYLSAAIEKNHYKIAVIGKTFVYPVGIYSKKIKSLAELPDKALVAIPNDPSNEARALLLLQKVGLITLKPGVSVLATPLDIVKNPKNLQLKELDAAQLPRALADATLAVLNTNYAIPAGLSPTRDALALEDAHSPYANIVVVRSDQQDKLQFKQLMAALHSQAVVDKAKQLFNGTAIAAW